MKKLILLSISSFVLFSCNNSSTEKTKIVEENNTQTEAHYHDDGEAIELNNGEKWTVNEEMKPFVLEGSDSVNSFIQENQSDYKTLAEMLTNQNSQLIQSCTMDGKSHDELHKWLHPHLEMTKELAEETNSEEAKQLILGLQESYKKYHKYFK